MALFPEETNFFDLWGEGKLCRVIFCEKINRYAPFKKITVKNVRRHLRLFLFVALIERDQIQKVH